MMTWFLLGWLTILTFVVVYKKKDKTSERPIPSFTQYSAVDLARYIIEYCIKIKDPAMYEQVMAILYVLQAYYLKNYRYPLFEDAIIPTHNGPEIKAIEDELGDYRYIATINKYGWVRENKIDKRDREIINPIIRKLMEKNIVHLRRLIEVSYAYATYLPAVKDKDLAHTDIDVFFKVYKD